MGYIWRFSVCGCERPHGTQETHWGAVWVRAHGEMHRYVLMGYVTKGMCWELQEDVRD